MQMHQNTEQNAEMVTVHIINVSGRLFEIGAQWR